MLFILNYPQQSEGTALGLHGQTKLYLPGASKKFNFLPFLASVSPSLDSVFARVGSVKTVAATNGGGVFSSEKRPRALINLLFVSRVKMLMNWNIAGWRPVKKIDMSVDGDIESSFWPGERHLFPFQLGHRDF